LLYRFQPKAASIFKAPQEVYAALLDGGSCP